MQKYSELNFSFENFCINSFHLKINEFPTEFKEYEMWFVYVGVCDDDGLAGDSHNRGIQT